MNERTKFTRGGHTYKRTNTLNSQGGTYTCDIRTNEHTKGQTDRQKDTHTLVHIEVVPT